jgi:hypothetical protein
MMAKTFERVASFRVEADPTMSPKTFERVASFRVEVDPTDYVTIGGGKRINMADSYGHVVEDRTDRSLSSDIHRINERLNHAVVVVAMSPTSHTRNRSPDLIPLTADYVQMKNDLQALLGVLITYQKCNRELQESRFKVAEQLAHFSERTPIQEEVGRELDGEATENLHLLSQHCSSPCSSLSTASFSSSISTPKPSSSMSFFLQSMGLVKEDDSQPTLVTQISDDYRKRSGANVLSLYGVYSLGAAQAVGTDSEYQLYVIEYTRKWMETITERVDLGLKHVRKLASERLHYERKIETLRNRATDLDRKGKTSPDSAIVRLSRNEAKLKEAFVAHENEAGKLCALIETVTQEGYKDLYTLVRNYMQWERNRVGRESDISLQLKLTLDSLRKKFEKTVEMKWEQRHQ